MQTLRRSKTGQSDAETGDLGVLPTHETSPRLCVAGSTCLGGMPPQVQVKLNNQLLDFRVPTFVNRRTLGDFFNRKYN